MNSQAERILSGSLSGYFYCVWYPPQQFPEVLIAESRKNILGKLLLNTFFSFLHMHRLLPGTGQQTRKTFV